VGRGLITLTTRSVSMEPWEVAARLSILDTLARYNHAGDGGVADEYAGCFTPDGVMEVRGSEPVVGREAIRQFLEDQKASLADAIAAPKIQHFVASHRIQFASPNEASVSAYFMAVTNIGPDHWGRYRDRFVPHDGSWLIEHRKVRVDGAIAGGWQDHRA
jgi:hypothetical protein